MDVDCRRPRHDENYSSLFVENSHPETLHRDMCIACSGSSWILPMYLTNFPFYAEMINLIHQKCWVSFLIVICPAGPNVYCCVPVDEKHWRPADGVVLPVRHSVFLWYLHLYDPEQLLPARYPWFLYRVRYRRYCVVYGA